MFGKKLEFYRKEMNLSQDELGKEINVVKSTISNWENGKSFPDGDKLLELANLFGVSVDCLLGNEPDKNEIEILNQYLRMAGIMNEKDTIDESELKYAIEYVLSMKKLYGKDDNGEERNEDK